MFLKTNKKFIIPFLGVLTVFLIIAPVIAQEEGREILQRTSENMMEIEAWWDLLWESTFEVATVGGVNLGEGIINGEGAGTNLSLYALVNPVRFVLGISLIFWIWNYGTKMVQSKGGLPGVQVFLQLLLPVLIVILFLSNQANYSRVLAYGLRDTINSWSDGVLNLTLVDVNIRGALQDMVVSNSAKEEIRRQWETCDALPQPEVTIPSAERPAPSGEDGEIPLTQEQNQVYDYIECLEQAGDFASDRLNEAEAQGDFCNGGQFGQCEIARRLFNAFFDVVTSKTEREVLRRISGSDLEEVDFDGEDFLALITRPGSSLLYFTQYMAISSLEMALYLNGLFAPLFVAASLLPGRQNLFGVWLIGSLTIGLARMAYIAIVGVVAVQKVTSGAITTTLDDTFLMTLGIFAPAVSLAVVTAGAIAAAFSYRNQSVGAASVAIGATSAIFSTLSYSISRGIDKNR